MGERAMADCRMSWADFRTPRRAGGTAAALLLAFVLPLQADDVDCRGLTGLVPAAKRNFDVFPDIADAPVLREAKCELSLALGGRRDFVCTWAFDYRDGAAAATFASMLERSVACFDAEAIAADQAVNHPDFYDQRSIESDGVELKVSIKDKAALRRTYVFFRVLGREVR